VQDSHFNIVSKNTAPQSKHEDDDDEEIENFSNGRKTSILMKYSRKYSCNMRKSLLVAKLIIFI
jgi:hypothetical protein